MISIKQTAKTRRNLRLIDELPQRVAALMDTVVSGTAQAALERVRDGIPKGKDLDAYRQSLEARRVVGAPGSEPTWIVYAKTVERVLDTKDKTVVLDIRPIRRLRTKTSEYVSVLARFSPWTPDTLPFYPTRREAVIYTRRVSKKEYQFVLEARHRDAPQWGLQLTKAGLPEKRRLTNNPTAIEDIAFTALRTELGGGDQRARQHWRPALQQFVGIRFGRYFNSQSRWMRILTDGNSRTWRTPIQGDKLPFGRLKRYAAFQRAILRRL